MDLWVYRARRACRIVSGSLESATQIVVLFEFGYAG
jgi:hypothetical protein